MTTEISVMYGSEKVEKMIVFYEKHVATIDLTS